MYTKALYPIPALLLSLAVITGPFGRAMAAGQPIGTASAKGAFHLDGAPVPGSATLFEGSIIETSTAPSNIRLSSGARLQLGPQARARIYGTRLVLERGSSQWTTAGAYAIEAASLKITPAARQGAAEVVLASANTVRVAASKGAFRVLSGAGILVSNLQAGDALELEPQNVGTVAPSSFIGCLLKKEGRFILYDQTTRIIVELRGKGLEAEWGNRVQVVGTAAAEAQPETGAYQVLDVTSMSRFGAGGCLSVAQAIAAELPPTAARPAAAPKQEAPARTPSVSAGTKVVVAAAIAGAAGAAIGSQVLSKEKTPRSP